MTEYLFNNHGENTLKKDELCFVVEKLKATVHYYYEHKTNLFRIVFGETKDFIIFMSALYYANTLRAKKRDKMFGMNAFPSMMWSSTHSYNCVQNCTDEIIEIGSYNELNPVLSDSSIKRTDITSLVEKVFKILNASPFYDNEKRIIKKREERIGELEENIRRI